jgi:hypothetical protein
MPVPGNDGPESAPDREGKDRPAWPDEPEDWEPPEILGIEGEYGGIFEEFDPTSSTSGTTRRSRS